MSHLGIKITLETLFGNNEETVKAHNNAIGKKITNIEIVDQQYDDELDWKQDGTLLIDFDDNTYIKIYDDGQSCCELRYLHTDDELSDFVGAEFVDAETREAPDVEDEWGVHEVQFLIVNTSLGSFTLETHNEHNGYYSGFLIKIEEGIYEED